MISDRYYYHQLCEDDKESYRVLYKGVTALDKEIHLSRNVSPVIGHRIFHAVTHDNPHLYYFNQTHMGVGLTTTGTVFLPQYFCSREQIETYNGRIQECVNRIVSDLDLENCSDFEKEKRLHDYFCLNVAYDYDALQTTKVGRMVASHSIIGVLAKHRAVCEGIAKAMKLLLNTVNVGCIVVSGNASLASTSEHAWNIVKINGQAYHLDITWDMANTKDGLVNYDYFNLADDGVQDDHFDFEGVPVCTATDANYFIRNNLCFKNMKHLEGYLLQGMACSQRDFYFKIEDRKHQMANVAIAARDFILAEAGKRGISAQVAVSYNDKQRIGRVILSEI